MCFVHFDRQATMMQAVRARFLRIAAADADLTFPASIAGPDEGGNRAGANNE